MMSVAEDIRVRFGGRRRELRQRRGWTQVETAKRLEPDQSRLAELERETEHVAGDLELIYKKRDCRSRES